MPTAQTIETHPLPREADTRSHLIEAHRRLLPRYGLPTLGNKPDPLDELVFICLAARTGYRQFERLYDELRATFPSWDDLADADVADIEDAIREAGLARKRALWIKGLLDEIRRRVGRLSLDCLAEMDDEEAEEFLCSLPGVGQKTARCVLMYSLHRDLFPVDTHARRILERLGLLDPTLHPLKSHDVGQGLVPVGFRRDLHILFVVHGREVCLATAPRCETCVLLDLCPTGRANANGT
jgi:endonuclease III